MNIRSLNGTNSSCREQMMFGALKLKQKVFASFFTVGLIATVVAVLSYMSFDHVLINFRGFIEHSSQAQSNLVLVRNVSEMQRQALIYTYEGHQSAAEHVHESYKGMMGIIEGYSGQESEYSERISRHLKAYMIAFEQLQQQRQLQQALVYDDLRDAATNAEYHFSAHMVKVKSERSERHLLKDQRILNRVLHIEKNAMRYFDSLDASYVVKVKENFTEVKSLLHELHDGMAEAVALEHMAESMEGLNEYERIFLEAVQRTRGYLFLVNVVMSAEAYEILYNADKMSETVTNEMGVIEQNTFSMLQQVFDSIVVAIIFSLLFVVLLSLLIGRALTKPVVGLTKAFNALSQGAQDTKIPPYQVDDEIGDLTRAAAVFKEKNLQTHSLLVQAEAMTAELMESEGRFRSLVENATDAFFLIDMQAHIVDVNRLACDSLGYSREELLSMKVPDFEADFSAEELGRMFKTLESGESRILLGTHNRKDGSSFPVEVSVGLILQGSESMVLALARDISERKQIEETVKLYSQAMEQSGEAIVITDANGVIEHINSAFTTITGYKEEEVIGREPSLLKSGNQDDEFYAKLWETITYGQTWQGKITNRKKNGDFYPAMLTISPLKNDAGETTHFIGIQQNLEKFEELEAQFHQSQKMEAIGTLVGGIAHDFNNNLAGITGNLYLAKKAAKSLPDVVERLNTVEKLSFGSAATIQQLLAFSRKGIVQMNPLSIASFLKETIKLQQVSLPENISLGLQINDTGMQVKGDINQLQQVLMNLINNAYDAVLQGENPTINIHLDRFYADDTFAALHEGSSVGEYARISVIDNGSGIKAEHIEHVFEPFFTTKEQGKGTGLGLAMAYGTIRTHGGYIEIKPAEQTGTIIQFYLPLIVTGEVVDFSAMEDEIIAGNGETILLVDDNETVRETGRDVLEGLGYKVLTAEDGLLAIEIYKLQMDEIDMLILDVVMPRLGGVEALKAIKDFNPDVKALFATGYNKRSTLSSDKHELTEKVISKPFAISKLSQAIRETLGKA